GRVAVTEPTRPAIQFDLDIDNLDLDAYMPAGAQVAPAPAGAATAAARNPNALVTLAADGRLRVGRLRAHGLQLSEVDLVLQAEDGQLRLAPLSASLYGGRYSGKVGIDARRSPLRLTLDERLEDIQLAPFLRDFSGTEARIAGRATVHARLQGNADSTDSLRRSITGQVDLRIVDGALKGINIAQMMREASARIRGTAAPSPSGRNETDFTDLSATLRIANGQVRNDDLALRAPLLRLTGAGSASLINETIDYRLRASAVATLAGQGGDELANLRGLTIPIRISGPFAEPRFALDIESLVADSLRERAAERIDERIRERVPEGVQDTLRRGLRDLLR
ncbi:MAG TPA: AsmA family protein, partial [Thauera sp.]|nr:AsmA family protein [Thauera sp.]